MMRHPREGFTLVELLVVITIIGILIATTNAQGRFILETVAPRQRGAVVGRHVVRITLTQPDRGAADSDASFALNPLPVRSHDGSLQFTVPSDGTDQANFNL